MEAALLAGDSLCGTKRTKQTGGMTMPEYRWEDRRIKTLRVAPKVLTGLLLQSVAYRVTSGLPTDARCVDLRAHGGDIILGIESEGYEPVKQGDCPPELDITAMGVEVLYKQQGERR